VNFFDIIFVAKGQGKCTSFADNSRSCQRMLMKCFMTVTPRKQQIVRFRCRFRIFNRIFATARQEQVSDFCQTSCLGRNCGFRVFLHFTRFALFHNCHVIQEFLYLKQLGLACFNSNGFT